MGVYPVEVRVLSTVSSELFINDIRKGLNTVRKVVIRKVKAFMQEENGATLAEYAILLVFLVATVLIIAMTGVKDEIKPMYEKVVETFRQGLSGN